jgi:hypothetical protein
MTTQVLEAISKLLTKHRVKHEIMNLRPYLSVIYAYPLAKNIHAIAPHYITIRHNHPDPTVALVHINRPKRYSFPKAEVDEEHHTYHLTDPELFTQIILQVKS